MQNPIIASSIVRLPSATPSSVNSSSVATAVAVSGATSLTRMVLSTGLVIFRGPRCRPSASRVPATAQTSVVMTAICTLTHMESCQSPLVNARRYQRVLKPVKLTSEEVELSENRMTTTSGVNMSRSAAATAARRNLGRSKPSYWGPVTPTPPSPPPHRASAAPRRAASPGAKAA